MKRMFLFLMTASIAIVGFAFPVGQKEALRKAAAFISQSSQSSSNKVLKAARRQPGMQLTASGGDANYFVFNIGEDDGFVIVSGDDRAVPILGYVDHGSFDAECLPDNVEAWLEGYSRQLRQLSASGNHDNSAVPVSRPAIEPMITTRWNQNEPFNSHCPHLPSEGSETSELLPLTGCVPVVMAQLMYYHRWPAATTAEIPSYETRTSWDNYGKLNVPGFPTGTSFEWDKMIETYSVELPEDEAEKAKAQAAQDAVAHLLSVCGAAVEVDYRDYVHGGSSADGVDAFYALCHYFGYSPMAQFVERDYYMFDEWQELIYRELQAKRPVIYGGQSSGGSHIFLVDGFDHGLFHINWGWGGFCDGYFALSVANPGSNEGAGASQTLDGYGLTQMAIIGLKKDEGEPASEVHMTSSIAGYEGNRVSASYFNHNHDTYLFELGFGYAKEDGTFALVGDAYQPTDPFPYTWGYKSLTFEVKGLADGIYRLVPVSRMSGTTKWLPNCNARRHFVKATVAGGNVTLELNQPVEQLKALSFNCPGKHKIGRRQQVDVTIQNEGDEYYGPIYFFVGQGSTVKNVAYTGITVEAGGVETATFYFEPELIGENILLVSTDQQCTKIIGQTTLNIKTQGETGEHLSVTALTFDRDNTTEWSVPDFAGKITVTNGGTEEFDGEMFLRIYYNAEKRYGSFSYLKDVYFEATIPAGATVDIPFNVEGLTPGIYYWPMVCVGGTMIWRTSDGADIRRYDPDLDAVRSVNDQRVVPDAWYDLSGRQMVARPSGTLDPSRNGKYRRGIYIHQGKKVMIR